MGVPLSARVCGEACASIDMLLCPFPRPCSPRISAWENSRTGYPFIDAAMAQLRSEGWLHHLARHAVACFLTRGDLYQV